MAYLANLLSTNFQVDEIGCVVSIGEQMQTFLHVFLLQFVNFTKIMSENTDTSKKEAAFALAALMEIPYQYRATQSLHFVK